MFKNECTHGKSLIIIVIKNFLILDIAIIRWMYNTRSDKKAGYCIMAFLLDKLFQRCCWDMIGRKNPKKHFWPMRLHNDTVSYIFAQLEPSQPKKPSRLERTGKREGKKRQANMKVKTISRIEKDFTQETKSDKLKVFRNFDPALHPFERPREVSDTIICTAFLLSK